MEPLSGIEPETSSFTLYLYFAKPAYKRVRLYLAHFSFEESKRPLSVVRATIYRHGLTHVCGL
jgi:hypothetical protein